MVVDDSHSRSAQATPDPRPSPAQYNTRKDQPAPQQTPTPNFYYDGVEKSFAEHKLDMAKRYELFIRAICASAVEIITWCE